jgi:hypothetical protein
MTQPQLCTFFKGISSNIELQVYSEKRSLPNTAEIVIFNIAEVRVIKPVFSLINIKLNTISLTQQNRITFSNLLLA